MSLIVKKFGGTSVASKENRMKVINKIIDSKNKADKVVVVVSAMGRLGNPYATDSLIQLGTQLLPREKDILMSCGEIISACTIVNELLKYGYKASVLTGGQSGIITNENYNSADIIKVTPQKIFDLIANNIIPVITGFQGLSEYGNITTLGRGGSDTTAAIIGEAINADAIEIYTDVEGIMTADPRVYPKAKVIDSISYNEVFQMADSGAKVIHPRAVEVARRAGIPLYIKNTFSDNDGTAIENCPHSKGYLFDFNNSKVITSIAYLNNRIQFCIQDKNINDSELFNELAKNQVSIDIINIFPTKKIFTVNDDRRDIVIKILEEKKLDYTYIENCSKVTLIGERMTGVPGVMAKIISALQNKNISLLQTADSLTTIACLIDSKDLNEAVAALHETFDL